MKISTIDFTNPNAGKELVESLKETGFAVIKNHSIDPLLIKNVYKDWEKFFESNNKIKYLYNKETQFGYFPFKSENAKDSQIKDLKEFYHVYGKETIPSEIQESTWELKKQLNIIGETLLGWIQNNLPKDISEKFSVSLNDMVSESSSTLFRVLHYPAIKGDSEVGAVRAYEHFDIDLLTVLLTASGPNGAYIEGASSGLEVRGIDGKWYEVKSDPNSIIINCGDMLQIATNGYLKSTEHKVVNPKDESAKYSRYSCPLFIHPRGSVILSGNKTAQDFLNERLKEIGLK